MCVECVTHACVSHLLVFAQQKAAVNIILQDAPFFTVKLGVQMLPCVVLFKSGVAVDRVVGFEGLGGVDDFKTAALEERLYQAEVCVGVWVWRVCVAA
jgi:thioredoxin-like negative regulator of GroEL